MDDIIFSKWLTNSTHPIDLFGTSVGAFKLAAAAQQDPSKQLERLVNAYINQHYEGDVTTTQVAVETSKIVDAFLSDQGIKDILKHKQFTFYCASVRCLGMLASDNINLQKLAMVKAFCLSLGGKKYHKNTFERAIFHSNFTPIDKLGRDGFTTRKSVLNIANFRTALLSSGSIPVVMPGVKDIHGAPAGTYRDGGLLDYHPIPSNITDATDGLVLYPHFYNNLKEGWFDKFAPWRKVDDSRLDNVVIIAPNAEYIS